MRNEISLLLVCTLFPLSALAQELPPLPVYVSSSSEDSVGTQLVHLIREKIRATPSMTLEASDIDAFMVIWISTMNPSPEPNSNLTVYSTAWSFNWLQTRGSLNYFLGHNVGMCNTNRLPECARDTIAMTDQKRVNLMAQMREALSEE